MKTLKFTEENGGKEAWLNARLGKITGSKLRDIIATRGGRKLGSYQLVVESIQGSAALAEEEDPMARGQRLEPVALERFRKETGKKVDGSLLMWISDTDSRIAASPDGVIGAKEAVEIKCLSSAKHIQAKIEDAVPADYKWQIAQYFIVNPKLTKLYFGMYDDRFPAPLDFFYFTLTRKDYAKEIAEWMEYEQGELKWVRDTVNSLTLPTA